MIKKREIVLIGITLAVALTQSNAAITYVNAVHGSGGNTFATGGSLADTSWTVAKNSSTADNSRWDVRLYGTGGQAYQANVSALGSMPELTTQFTISSSDGWYDIYAFFYEHPDGWNISAGLNSGSLTTYAASSPAVNATTLTYVSDPTFVTAGVINLYAVKLGQVEVTGGSATVNVYIDKLEGINHADRSWYDGVGYEPGIYVPPPITKYVDANSSNTVASGGSPDPFYTNDVPTTDNLWRKRSGFGFDVNGNAEIFEKDSWVTVNGIGDATPLETTADGLVPGEEYGVYVCFLSAPGEAWQVKAGLDSNNLITFNPNTAGRIEDLGETTAGGATLRQYRGFIGNTNAALDGTIVVQIDDGEGTDNTTRTWYEGVYIGETNSVSDIIDGGIELIAPDGAYCWFQDERAIWHQGYLYAGYVRTDGHYGITRYDPVTSSRAHMVISTPTSMQYDDHNNPSITVLPDNRLLVVYSQHGYQNVFYYRTSKVTAPTLDSDWNVEKSHYAGAGTTYANTYRLVSEGNKIYNFHRAIGYDPTLSISSDLGETWGTARQVINAGNNSQRPYPRYCSNHDDRIDFIYTEAHPDAQPTSIYHMYYQTNAFMQTDGTLVRTMANLPIQHDSGERGSYVYQYSSAAWGAGDGPDDWIPSARGWTWDVAYGADGHPICVFHVQPMGGAPGSNRFYYYYARWTGTEWQKRVIATGGGSIGHWTYTGGITIDPEDPRVVYISSNADDPFNLSDLFNVPISSGNKFEIYRGVTFDGGLTFEWSPVTSDSESDNLRPLVPENHGRTRHVVWFSGRYTSYVNFDCQVEGVFGEAVEQIDDWRSDYGVTNGLVTADSDFDGLSDLAEYALGGNPTNALDTPRPQLIGQKYTFNHLPLRADVESAVEVSTNLIGGVWSEVITVRNGSLPNTATNGFSLGSEGGDPEQLSVPLNPETNGPALFMRLKIRER